jgi:hypothetical protein
MIKKLLLIFFSIILFLSISCFLPRSTFADGMVLEPLYSGHWDYSDEDNQQALINYDNGIQKMIISIGINKMGTRGAIWIFPVPSNPENIAIDVIKSFPELHGEEISEAAKSSLADIEKNLRSTQIYPAFFESLTDRQSLSSLSLPTVDMNGLQKIDEGVIVHEHLEKEGITTEIITANNANGLFNYLKSKDLQVEIGSIPVLDSYIGQDFSFVVAWINSTKKIITAQDIKNNLTLYFLNLSDYPKFDKEINNLRKIYPKLDQAVEEYNTYNFFSSADGEVVLQDLAQSIQKDPSIITKDYEQRQESKIQKGLSVSFVTKDVYFPLLPTSVYESKVVPATIRVFGYVAPKLFQGIKAYTKTEYYVNGYLSNSQDLGTLYRGKNENIKYTKVEINAPSKFLTEDLLFENKIPNRVYYASFVVNNTIAITIILLIISSIVTSVLIGFLFFKDLRRNIIKLSLIGLSNCFTILGLIITIITVGTKNKNENVDALLSEIKQKGYFWRRRAATILFIIEIPLAIVFLFGLFQIPYVIGTLNDSFSEIVRDIGFKLFINLAIIYILPILILAIGIMIKRIKPEDQNLFTQLKSKQYSTWSFQHKDLSKVIFVPLFSISFLIISYLLIRLIELTI